MAALDGIVAQCCLLFVHWILQLLRLGADCSHCNLKIVAEHCNHFALNVAETHIGHCNCFRLRLAMFQMRCCTKNRGPDEKKTGQVPIFGGMFLRPNAKKSRPVSNFGSSNCAFSESKGKNDSLGTKKN